MRKRNTTIAIRCTDEESRRIDEVLEHLQTVPHKSISALWRAP